MTMSDRTRFTDYDSWRDRDAYDADGNKIGSIEEIYYDDVSRRPEWVAIKTGLFGMKRSLAPIGGSSVYTDPTTGESHLQLRLRKDEIKSAPQVDVGPGSDLSDMDEQRLYEYYGHEWAGRSNSFTATDRVDAAYDTGWDRQREGDVVAEETVVNERVQKTEQPRTVRLRKYQWTEQVPVQHEEVRMEEEGSSRERPTRLSR